MLYKHYRNICPPLRSYPVYVQVTTKSRLFTHYHTLSHVYATPCVYVSTHHLLPSLKVHFFMSPGFSAMCFPTQVIFWPSYSMLLFRSSSKFSVSCDMFSFGFLSVCESNKIVSLGVG